jgi:hypothetical protein
MFVKNDIMVYGYRKYKIKDYDAVPEFVLARINIQQGQQDYKKSKKG